MACKALKIIAALIVAALIPISAMAGGRTLCDLFDVEEDIIQSNGNFQVYYDQRRVNPGETIFQYPQGGIKFELAAPLFYEETERDAFLRNIKMVVLHNRTTGDRYTLRSPDVYKLLDLFSAEYGLHIGSTRHVLGDWKVIVYGRRWVSYKAYFTINEDMLDQEAPIPVKARVRKKPNELNGDYRVKCGDKGADLYRLRVFDEEGVPWQIDMNCNIFGSPGICQAVVPAEYGGFRARIEARNFGQRWPRLFGEWGNPDTCDPYGMNPGSGYARSITWFDIP